MASVMAVFGPSSRHRQLVVETRACSLRPLRLVPYQGLQWDLGLRGLMAVSYLMSQS